MSYLENGTFDDIHVEKLAIILKALGASAEVVLQEAGYLPAQPSGFPEPRAYLTTTYGLSRDDVDHALAYLDFLASKNVESRQLRSE